ncbi:PREDICTED: putative DNA glycosylase At3g47830 [Tarenaya hassleriana]|uniref:putative DNA glycosylase At3g47830 n=1 Tax=Tarenaya hassleriana TaxID=28532 RepID=UPI00053C3D8B|nr:PREDICTED: putative DNA glycosylase At3g47830 [Tarenaya hassleriana]
MNKAHKRKRPHPHDGDSKSPAVKPTVDGRGGGDPYPTHPRPTPDECRAVRDVLLSLHGFPPEFAGHRRRRLRSLSDVDGGTDCDRHSTDTEEDESVLDGLVKTLLSQNTTEANSLRAFASLKAAFPTWEDVLVADLKSIEDAIRCGGLAPKKAACIKNILARLHSEKGKLCLEYLRGLSVDEVKTELSRFKGVGPKTVSCILMFNLQHNDFPVDTHVFEISKTMGWVPAMADRNKTYVHLNRRIPDLLKFDLNCLLYTHGKLCTGCKKNNSSKSKGKVASSLDDDDDDDGGDCPLLNLDVKTLNPNG